MHTFITYRRDGKLDETRKANRTIGKTIFQQTYDTDFYHCRRT